MGKIAAIIALAALAACQTAGGSFCDLAKPIRLSAAQVDALTDSQVAEYLGHNERGRRECGWRE